MDKKQIAVILSGCGHLDGSEIHEATLTLLAIHKLGAEYRCFAPDKNQHHVVNHITGEEMGERRNVLIEAARIARGNIESLQGFNPSDYDALILPGGFGAAKNLSDYAFTGAACSVNEDVAKAISGMHASQKPIGALCIAPAIVAKVIHGAEVTIGQDTGTAENIAAMGAQHTATLHGEIVVDEKNKILTTPCYMLDSRVDQIYEGVEKLVLAMLEMC